MPITLGEDNYRAFGPMLQSPGGNVSVMVFSSSVQLGPMPKLNDYKQFGFDNAAVTKFLTVHKISHSIVNPQLEAFKNEIAATSKLFTPELSRRLEFSYIGNWETCIIEHLVRLGEIRVAKAMGDREEESRLRKMHTQEFRFVLLPILEKNILEYENDRLTYPDFKSFLPRLFNMLETLSPDHINAMVKENDNSPKG